MDHEKVEKFRIDVERLGVTLAQVMNEWEQEADAINTGTFEHMPALDWFVRIIGDQTGQHMFELGAEAMSGQVRVEEAADSQRMALLQVIELALRVGLEMGKVKYAFAVCSHVDDFGHEEMSDEEIQAGVEELLRKLRLN